jgi:beta-aspartyl-peptidase (threonine type)
VEKALTFGWEILFRGGSSLEAVETAINYMEDDPTFDAGRGLFVNSHCRSVSL